MSDTAHVMCEIDPQTLTVTRVGVFSEGPNTITRMDGGPIYAQLFAVCDPRGFHEARLTALARYTQSWMFEALCARFPLDADQ